MAIKRYKRQQGGVVIQKVYIFGGKSQFLIEIPSRFFTPKYIISIILLRNVCKDNFQQGDYYR